MIFLETIWKILKTILRKIIGYTSIKNNNDTLTKNRLSIKNKTMKETTLLKIALICSLVGLVLLYFISTKIEVKDYKPNILNKNVGDDVKLTGKVSKITDRGDVVFIEVDQQSPINVVLFTDNDNLKLSNGDNVEVIGKVQEYNGKNEIIAEKIRLVK